MVLVLERAVALVQAAVQVRGRVAMLVRDRVTVLVRVLVLVVQVLPHPFPVQVAGLGPRVSGFSKVRQLARASCSCRGPNPRTAPCIFDFLIWFPLP